MSDCACFSECDAARLGMRRYRSNGVSNVAFDNASTRFGAQSRDDVDIELQREESRSREGTLPLPGARQRTGIRDEVADPGARRLVLPWYMDCRTNCDRSSNPSRSPSHAADRGRNLAFRHDSTARPRWLVSFVLPTISANLWGGRKLHPGALSSILEHLRAVHNLML